MVSQSIASEARWKTGLAQGAIRVGNQRATRGGPRKSLRTIAGGLDDLMFLLLAVLLLPVAVLAVGAPLALFVRLLLEIARRL